MKIQTCKAKTQSGKPCAMAAMKESKYCFTHNPQAAAQRATAHKLGGQRTRPGHGGDGSNLPTTIKTIAQAMTILDYTLRELLQLENSIQRSRALIALVGGYVDAVKVGEIESRMIAIEAALKARPEVNQ